MTGSRRKSRKKVTNLDSFLSFRAFRITFLHFFLIWKTSPKKIASLIANFWLESQVFLNLHHNYTSQHHNYLLHFPKLKLLNYSFFVREKAFHVVLAIHTFFYILKLVHMKNTCTCALALVHLMKINAPTSFQPPGKSRGHGLP